MTATSKGVAFLLFYWAAFMLLALQNREDDTNYLVRRFYIDCMDAAERLLMFRRNTASIRAKSSTRANGFVMQSSAPDSKLSSTL
jgi:hypothetical protein